MNDSPNDKAQMLTITEAWEHIKNNLLLIREYESVDLITALHRTLAEEIRSYLNLPSNANSAMDGYAVRSRDLSSVNSVELVVTGTSFAGKPYMQSVDTGHCVRIFTGALLPPMTDTVIMQEQVTRQSDKVMIPAGQRAHQHVRAAGEDIQIGQIVLQVGKRLLPADIGLLATLGINKVKVTRKLKVALLSTGDELCNPGETLEYGQIYDSNRYLLHSMLLNLAGIEITDKGIVRDNPEAIEQAFEQAVINHDVLITSGGVSVGDADYVTSILNRLGTVHFWKVAIKPGKPLAFGKIHNTLFFGLPGNPVSAMITFYQLVQPALRYMMGQHDMRPLQLKARCITPLKKRAGRLEFQRGILDIAADGSLEVRSTGNQGSGVLSSMSQANCFIILPSECGNVTIGSEVTVEPLTTFLE